MCHLYIASDESRMRDHMFKVGSTVGDKEDLKKQYQRCSPDWDIKFWGPGKERDCRDAELEIRDALHLFVVPHDSSRPSEWYQGISLSLLKDVASRALKGDRGMDVDSKGRIHFDQDDDDLSEALSKARISSNDDDQCQATCKSTSKRCTNRAKYGRFCGIHK